jgi:hypothetical protein
MKPLSRWEGSDVVVVVRLSKPKINCECMRWSPGENS